jgi:predicted transcriptional regulator
LKLTAIKRLYLSNKAIKKSLLPVKYLHLLYTIYLLQPALFFSIQKKLIRCKREIGGSDINNYIKYLVDNGFILRDENNRLYSLTDAGLSLLKDIENRLRKERHDK